MCLTIKRLLPKPTAKVKCYKKLRLIFNSSEGKLVLETPYTNTKFDPNNPFVPKHMGKPLKDRLNPKGDVFEGYIHAYKNNDVVKSLARWYYESVNSIPSYSDRITIVVKATAYNVHAYGDSDDLVCESLTLDMKDYYRWVAAYFNAKAKEK